jgi:hypothetical protein
LRIYSTNVSKFDLNYLFEDKQFFIVTLDFSNNQIILNQYEYTDGNLKSTIRKIKTEIDFKTIDYCNLTYKSKFLFIAYASQSVSYFDLNTMRIISNKTFNEIEIKLSDKFEPVVNTDDFILLAIKPKTQNLVVSYFELNYKDEKYLIDTFEITNGRSILNIKLNKTYLCLIDYSFNIKEIMTNTKTKMNVFDLAQVKNLRSFDRSLFDYELQENLTEFCLSYNNRYLYVVELLNLCVFRLQDKQKMINIPLGNSISQIWTHEEKYVNLILVNGELISLALIDSVDEIDNLKIYENIKKIR